MEMMFENFFSNDFKIFYQSFYEKSIIKKDGTSIELIINKEKDIKIKTVNIISSYISIWEKNYHFDLEIFK